MHNEKSLAAVLGETKEELKDFLNTRVGLLRAEIEEKISTWKAMFPLLLLTAALLLGAWMVITFCVTAFLHGLFLPSPYAWAWASLIVGGSYLVFGIVLGWFVYGEIKSAGIRPARTLQVLKQDQIWLQNEAKSA